MLVAVGVVILLISHVLYIGRVESELRREELRTGELFGRVYGALGDTTTSAASTVASSALFDLARRIREMGVPLILTDQLGRPTDCANLPFCDPLDTARARARVADLDRANAPVTVAGVVTVHFGHTPNVRWLRVIPYFQGAMLLIFLIAAGSLVRTRARAATARVWAGMARESAHQLATPLSSLSGWMELLAASPEPALIDSAVAHMRADVERLERVAHRFERIGREARREPVDIVRLVERVAAYFRARAPTLAHSVSIDTEVVPGDHPLVVQGDGVLLEWALEALVKNALDALAGRGGHVRIRVEDLPEGNGVLLRVADDGPGVPRELRSRIFEAGFTTKDRGWGIGLSLARRIVEVNHRGRLTLAPSESGAVFNAILR